MKFVFMVFHSVTACFYSRLRKIVKKVKKLFLLYIYEKEKINIYINKTEKKFLHFSLFCITY